MDIWRRRLCWWEKKNVYCKSLNDFLMNFLNSNQDSKKFQLFQVKNETWVSWKFCWYFISLATKKWQWVTIVNSFSVHTKPHKQRELNETPEAAQFKRKTIFAFSR